MDSFLFLKKPNNLSDRETSWQKAITKHINQNGFFVSTGSLVTKIPTVKETFKNKKLLLDTSKNQDAIKSEVNFHGIVAVEAENNGFEKNPHNGTTKRTIKNYNPEKMVKVIWLNDTKQRRREQENRLTYRKGKI